MSDVEGDSIPKVEIEDPIHALAVNVQEKDSICTWVELVACV